MGLTNVGHGCTTAQLGLDVRAILKIAFFSLSQGLATPTHLGSAPQVLGTSSTLQPSKGSQKYIT
jgi:hypothetical protein